MIIGYARVSTADQKLDAQIDLVIADGALDLQDREFYLNGGYQFLQGRVNTNWLEVDLIDDKGLQGLGARLQLVSGDTIQYRAQNGGVHRNVQEPPRIHFGMGQDEAGLLRVFWADGASSELRVKANQLRVVEHPNLERK
ncbi:MAG: ASPIC/UnbV domain-containing protein [Pseudomonadota bacterium]